MRKTKNDLLKLQAAGFYREVDLPAPTNVLDDVEKKIAEKIVAIQEIIKMLKSLAE
jgi:hypothetical protein